MRTSSVLTPDSRPIHVGLYVCEVVGVEELFVVCVLFVCCVLCAVCCVLCAVCFVCCLAEGSRRRGRPYLYRLIIMWNETRTLGGGCNL